jgi:hypothetical protein
MRILPKQHHRLGLAGVGSGYVWSRGAFDKCSFGCVVFASILYTHPANNFFQRKSTNCIFHVSSIQIITAVPSPRPRQCLHRTHHSLNNRHPLVRILPPRPSRSGTRLGHAKPQCFGDSRDSKNDSIFAARRGLAFVQKISVNGRRYRCKPALATTIRTQLVFWFTGKWNLPPHS